MRYQGLSVWSLGEVLKIKKKKNYTILKCGAGGGWKTSVGLIM